MGKTYKFFTVLSRSLRRGYVRYKLYSCFHGRFEMYIFYDSATVFDPGDCIEVGFDEFDNVVRTCQHTAKNPMGTLMPCDELTCTQAFYSPPPHIQKRAVK